jgi:protein FAM50
MSKKRKQALDTSRLSFDVDKEDEEDVRITKNESVDTSYLPDKKRAEREQQARHRKAIEWRLDQARIMEQEIKVQFVYWDGAVHKYKIECQKKLEIGQFLEKCRKQIAKQFHACRNISSENMVLAIHDMVIPHTYSFYQLEALKCKNPKSKQVFVSEGAEELEQVFVVTRHWYERNREIYPCIKWTVFESDKVTVEMPEF